MDDVLSALPILEGMLQKVQGDGLWTPLHVMHLAMEPGGLFAHLNVVLGFGSVPGDEGYETDAAATGFTRLSSFCSKHTS